MSPPCVLAAATGARLIPFRTAATDACIIHRESESPTVMMTNRTRAPRSQRQIAAKFSDFPTDTRALRLICKRRASAYASGFQLLRSQEATFNSALFPKQMHSIELYIAKASARSKLDDGSSRNSFHVSFISPNQFQEMREYFLVALLFNGRLLPFLDLKIHLLFF